MRGQAALEDEVAALVEVAGDAVEALEPLEVGLGASGIMVIIIIMIRLINNNKNNNNNINHSTNSNKNNNNNNNNNNNTIIQGTTAPAPSATAAADLCRSGGRSSDRERQMGRGVLERCGHIRSTAENTARCPLA